MSSPRRLYLAAALLLVIVPLAFFWQMIVEGQEPLAPDTQAAAPFRVWAESASRGPGETPVWCPMIFCGMPSYGSFIYTPSSPFDITRWLRKSMSDNRGGRYYVTMLIGGFALYGLLLLRRCSPLVAAVSSLIYIMTPYFLGLIAAGHSTKLHALHLVPLVFLSFELLLRKRTLAAMAFFAFSIALQLWNNHPQISYYTLLLAGIYGGLVLLFDRPVRFAGRGLPKGIGLVALALAIAAVLVLDPYLSVFEYTPYSVRGTPGALEASAAGASGAGWDYATAWSYPPAELPAFFFPGWFGLEGVTYWGKLPFTQSTHYFGIAALALAVLGLALSNGRRKWIELSIAGFILLVGLGRNLALLYRPLYELLPFFDRFRVPSMIYSLLPFFIALLAADGLSALARGGTWLLAAPKRDRAKPGQLAFETPTWGRRLLSTWPIVTVVLWALLLFWVAAGGAITAAMRDAGLFAKAGEAQRYGEQMNWLIAQRMLMVRHSAAIGLLLLALTAAIVESRRRRIVPGAWAAGLLGLVIVADLWVIDRRFYDPMPRRETEAILQPDAVTRWLQAQPKPYRIAPLTQAGFTTNRHAAFGIESVGGYQPAKLRIYEDLIRSSAVFSLPVLGMLNARYLVTDRPLPPDFPECMHAETAEGTTYVYENPGALARAWFAERAEVAPAAPELLKRLAAPDFEPARLSWIAREEDVSIPAALSQGEVGALDVTAHAITATVRVPGPQPGLLIFSEIMYPPGWKATIDGRETRLLTANHVLRSVLVEPGEHRVELRADFSAYRFGRTLSLVAGMGLLAVTLASGGGRRLLSLARAVARRGKPHASDSARRIQ